MINCRNISKGKAKGELIVSSEPISFLGGVNPENGEIIDPGHELKGEIIKDKILFIPGGKGSTVGSYVIFQMKKNNTSPKAIICLNAEPIIATGAIMSDIPMVDLAYSAVLFNNKEAAEEVVTLENRVNTMNYEIKKQSLLAARSLEDAEQLTTLLEIAEAAESMGNAAKDLADLALKGLLWI